MEFHTHCLKCIQTVQHNDFLKKKSRFLVGLSIVETSLEMTAENAFFVEFRRPASLSVCRICHVIACKS